MGSTHFSRQTHCPSLMLSTRSVSTEGERGRAAQAATQGLSVHLTQRVHELGSLPPPQSSVFMREHIMGLVLMKFIVERHFIQETVHLPTPSKKPSHTFTHGPYRGLYICSGRQLLSRLLTSSQTTAHQAAPIPRPLLSTAAALCSPLLSLTHHPVQCWESTQGLADTGEALTA